MTQPDVADQPLRRNCDFRKLWVGQTVSVLGSRISWVAFPLLVLALTGSPSKAGIVSFANSLPALLMGIPAGVLVDRWSRRRTMIVCDTARALLLGALAFTLARGEASFSLVVLVAFGSRCADVFFNPAEIAALQRIVPSDQLSEAIARNESREYGAFLIGPTVGGALYSLGRALPFLVDAISYCVSLISVLTIRSELGPERSIDAERTSLLGELREGLRFTLRTPFLRTTMLIVGGTNLISNGVGLTLILAVRESFNPYFVSLPLALLLFVAPTLNAVLIGHQIALVPDRLQARVEGASSVISTGAISIGTLAAGLLLDNLGRTATIELFAVLMTIVAATILASPSIRHGLGTSPTRRPAATSS